MKPLFSAHYDTVNAGPKLEKASYEKICREMGVGVSRITFLTDNVKGTFTSPNRAQSIRDRYHPVDPHSPTPHASSKPAHLRQHPFPSITLIRNMGQASPLSTINV